MQISHSYLIHLCVIRHLDENAYSGKSERIAEMRFLRGYFFLDLKKWYKWIPYFDENATNDSIAKIPNHPDTATNDLYKWQNIYNDFAAAANVLPATQSDFGRPTKYAAEGEMLQCLMWGAYEEDKNNNVVNINKERLSQALPLADDIINSGQYSLAPDFAINFSMLTIINHLNPFLNGNTHMMMVRQMAI